MKTGKFIVTALAVLALSSCKTSTTVLPYFTNLPDGIEVEMADYSLKIVPDDELMISVTANDVVAVQDYMIPYQKPTITDFNSPTNQAYEGQLLQRKAQILNYMTYRVNHDGFINFPVLGKIHVAGMTLEGLTDYLTEKIGEKVIDPIVTVELLNFHINVMGEVSSPGVQLINRERVTVLDAIAAARDLTAYGERSNVLLIREEDGKRTYHRLDLNDAKLFESPYFYLQQNDVIYVEPNDVKRDNLKYSNDRNFKLTMTSVIVSAASVIASLAIALFIRR